MRNERDMLYTTPAPNGFAAPRDYRAPARPPVEPNMLRMGLMAGGIAIVALGAMSLWTWAGHRHGSLPVVEADGRPVRERPVDQGGMKVEGANEAILSGNTDSRAVVTAAPESPALGALHAAAPTPQPAPVAQTVAPSTSDDKVRVAALSETPSRPLLSATRQPGEPAPVVATTSQPTPAPASPTHAAAQAAPATKTVATSHLASKQVAAAEAPMAHAAPAAVASGASMVQLAALNTEAAANAEWSRLERKFPSLLGGREPEIVKAEHNGKSFWRVRITGFADHKTANEFCSKLKSSGGQCTLAAG